MVLIMTKKRTKRARKIKNSGVNLSTKKKAKLDKFEGYLNALTNIVKIIRG